MQSSIRRRSYALDPRNRAMAQERKLKARVHKNVRLLRSKLLHNIQQTGR
jgi:hypothetical protein